VLRESWGAPPGWGYGAAIVHVHVRLTHTRALSSLQESLKPKAMIRGRVNFNYATFEAGEQTAKSTLHMLGPRSTLNTKPSSYP